MSLPYGPPAARRILGVAVASAVALGLGPAAETSFASASYVTLGGTTTLTLAAATGTQLVSVPKAVRFGGNCEPEPLVSVRGTADSVVLALVPLNVTAPTPVLFGRLPKAEGGRTFSTLCGAGVGLAAGKYKLVALHTAGSATVTLRLPGLGGRANVRLRPANLPATLARLDAIQPYATTNGVESFAATHPLAGQGFVMVVGWNRMQSDAPLEQGDCEVSGPVANLPLAATEAPGCPLGSGGSNVPTAVGPGENFWAGGESNVAAATYSAGYFVVTGEAPVSAGAVALWVPFGV